jgi:hypothetical protein
MTESQVREAILRQFGLRIQPEMGQYVARQLSKSRESIPVIGGNARTGVAVRQLIPANELASAVSQPASSQAI